MILQSFACNNFATFAMLFERQHLYGKYVRKYTGSGAEGILGI